MNFGTKLDEQGSFELLDRYLEAGGRFIDTANNYALWWGGDGTEPENVLGRWAHRRKNGWLAYCCLQQRHTYLRPVAGARFDPQLAVDEELLDCCASHAADFLLLGYSSTLGGGYSGRPDRPIPPQYRGPANEARLSTLSEVAREVGATPLRLVYAWMLHSAPLALPLVSAGSLRQLDENLGALESILNAGQMKRLDEAGDPPKD
jgi:aryl-alcohol dehydrogenase-like predicted oxidoreductase